MRIDGYSMPVQQPNARRQHVDHEGDPPCDCLELGTDFCLIGHPSLVLSNKDLVDLGARAAKLTRALKAAQAGVQPFFAHVASL